MNSTARTFTAPTAPTFTQLVNIASVTRSGDIIECRTVRGAGVFTGEEPKLAARMRRALRLAGIKHGTIHADAGRAWTVTLGPVA